MHCVLFTDGGSRGNPGPAGAGYVLYQDKDIKHKGSKYLGKKTNNEAEYSALVLGLEKAIELGFKDLEVNMDSELIVKQMRGEYKVKNKNLIALFANVIALTNKFDNISFKHIRREKNELADELVNEVLDKEMAK